MTCVINPYRNLEEIEKTETERSRIHYLLLYHIMNRLNIVKFQFILKTEKYISICIKTEKTFLNYIHKFVNSKLPLFISFLVTLYI